MKDVVPEYNEPLKIYLAGPIKNKENGDEYREELKEKVVEQLEESQYMRMNTENVKFLDPTKYFKGLRQQPRSDLKMQTFVNKDLGKIREADIFIGWIPEDYKGAGTIMELFHADRNDVYTMVATDREQPSVWIDHHANDLYQDPEWTDDIADYIVAIMRDKNQIKDAIRAEEEDE